MKKPAVIWRISDNKPGHDSQSIGLSNALARLVSSPVQTLPALSTFAAIQQLISRQTLAPAPDWIIGAGHRTHLTLLALQRSYNARAVVLMRPSLPAAWFYACIIPAHDQPRPRDNVFISDGALCPIISPPPNATRSGENMILIGGESPHFDWDNQHVIQQIYHILQKSTLHGQPRWLLTTSRRTPSSFLNQLPVHPHLHIVPFEATPKGWLADRLLHAPQAWITADSVSMIFEAITAGCGVGVIELLQGRGRIARNISHLQQQGRILRSQDYQNNTAPPVSPEFNEAERAAHWLIDNHNG